MQVLLFADDTVLVTETETDNIKALQEAVREHRLAVNWGAVLKLQKPFAHTNKPLEATKAQPNLLTMPILSLHMPQLQGRRGFSGQAVLTMKVFAVLQGLLTATLLSGKSGIREEGRESWDKE